MLWSYDVKSGTVRKRLASLLALLLFAGNVAALRAVLAPAYSAEGTGRLTRLDTPAGSLLIQHDPPGIDGGLPPDRSGRWVLAAPAGKPTSVRLLRGSEQALLADALVAGHLDDPANLPGVSIVTSHGPGDSPAARVRPLSMTVGQVQRGALLSHLTSRIVLDPVRIPAGAQVRVILGIDDRVQGRVGPGGATAADPGELVPHRGGTTAGPGGDRAGPAGRRQHHPAPGGAACRRRRRASATVPTHACRRTLIGSRMAPPACFDSADGSARLPDCSPVGGNSPP